jgi:hypothetical protein
MVGMAMTVLCKVTKILFVSIIVVMSIAITQIAPLGLEISDSVTLLIFVDEACEICTSIEDVSALSSVNVAWIHPYSLEVKNDGYKRYRDTEGQLLRKSFRVQVVPSVVFLWRGQYVATLDEIIETEIITAIVADIESGLLQSQ